MLLVVEVPEEAEAVELVVGVGVVQLLEELQLLQTRLLPGRRWFFPWLRNPASTCPWLALPGLDSHQLVVSDDLDCHLLASSGGVPGSDHVAKHPLARVAVNIVALVQRFPNVDP